MQSSHYRDQVQRVNRRLAAARFHLSIAAQETTTQLQQEACLESCLYQVHFSLLHYLDELLLCYQRPVIPKQAHDLNALLNESPKVFAAIPEFEEVKQWYHNHSINLSPLINLLPNAVSGLPTLESVTKTQVVNASLIASAKEDKTSLLNIDQLTQVLNELHSLIDKQRQNQLEY